MKFLNLKRAGLLVLGTFFSTVAFAGTPLPENSEVNPQSDCPTLMDGAASIPAKTPPKTESSSSSHGDDGSWNDRYSGNTSSSTDYNNDTPW